MIYGELVIFSLCWLLILLYHAPNGFLPVSCHVSPISVGFQLTLFFQTGQAWPWIQPPPEDRFQGALDPGNCPQLCRAQLCPLDLNPIVHGIWVTDR